MIFRLSLIALTTALKKSVGEVELAQVLHDGRLLIKCKDVGQRDKAMRLTSVCKKEVVRAGLHLLYDCSLKRRPMTCYSLKPLRYSGQNHLPFRGQHLTTTVGFLPICLKTPVQ